MATFNTVVRWLILGSLLLAAACADGGSYAPGPTPNYNYYPNYYGPSYYPESDPEFWRMWEDRQGGG